jgi:DNA-binding IclR family transcriptional regulator
MTARRSLPTRWKLVSRRRSRYAAPALDKGLDILELLSSASEALTHSEIASRLGRTRTEVFRMLVCLEQRRYISRTRHDERYQLTLKLFEIAHIYHPLQRLIRQARPLVQRVASNAGQSCHLAMLSHSEVVVVVQSDAPGNMGFSVRLGANIDLLNTGSGHVILAFQSDEVRARALEAWRLRSKAPIPAGIYRHLNQIRRRGYEELGSYQVHGVVNISYPVLNQHGEAIAAMTVPFLARIGDSIGAPQIKEALALASRTLASAVGGNMRKLSSGTVQP